VNQTFVPAASAWLRCRQDNPAASLRLFCFPYAGGSAAVYRNWTDLPAEIDVCPVQLPGRDERFREPAFTRADALCDALVVALADYLDRPFAVFGHSMGRSSRMSSPAGCRPGACRRATCSSRVSARHIFRCGGRKVMPCLTLRSRIGCGN